MRRPALADRPLLLLGVLLIVLGVQITSIGLLGEIIIFTQARNLRDYRVAEVIRGVRAKTVSEIPTERPPVPPLEISPAAEENGERPALQVS